MSRSLRLSEKWFRRGLWLVALVFAGFLIGLGGRIVDDLPRVESATSIDDFMDAAKAADARRTIDAARQRAQTAQDALAQARLQQRVAASDVGNARQGFENWIATRKATERAEQDPEVVTRTRALDGLQARERAARAEVERQQQALLDASQARDGAQRQLQQMQDEAQGRYERALRARELRVFGYRLALTLPLLLLAGWLFAKKRKSSAWPFVWGFILFALFAFFVELVPYLPSYGGYVRYAVGIVLTVLVGRWAIAALNRYLARQQAAEAQPEQERRRELSYDTALARLAKGVCPGCERAVDLKDGHIDFCPHCGIGLFNRCGRCDARKSSFAHYCHACGTAAAAGLQDG
ncbi:MAG: serine endopeptidase [Burkholderiaceae bacterium]|nr:serine endopeptidase [Pseudomonadota bacterium]MCO5116994.1 zinc ribbon domain-containing protein [Burkholderiaceae bacterium]MCP5216704.1 serine endopeptidase [Burkholderiaceae bacterium]